MINFNTILLTSSVFFALLRVCSVETPDLAQDLKTTEKILVSLSTVAEVKEVQQQAPISDDSSVALLSLSSSGESSLSSASSQSSSLIPTKETKAAAASSDLTYSSSLEHITSTTELELLVNPTIAPATPHYDLESITPSAPVIVSSTVSIQQDNKIEEKPAKEEVVPEPEQFKVVQEEVVMPEKVVEQEPAASKKTVSETLDNTETEAPSESPKVHVVSDTPPKDGIPATETKDKEEDSITDGLKQAEEEIKPTSEEMPSFDEFKRQLLQEEEQKSKQKKQHDVQNTTGTPSKPKSQKVKQRKQNNYASMDCGAKIVNVNPEASNAHAILQENRDVYMLNPCGAKVWFIVELCDTAHVKSIEIANFELFSSTPESFRVYVSGRYPTREWTMLGTFQARDERELQSFPLGEPVYAKYLKIEMLSHFGSEHYCPLSLLRVFGTSMMEELEDHEADSQDESYAVDHDDDTVQVLPPDPSAKPEDHPSIPSIFTTVGGTLFNIVKEVAKKLTGVMKHGERNLTQKDVKDQDALMETSVGVSSITTPSSMVSSSAIEEQGKAKPSIVTLLEDDDDKQAFVKSENKTVNVTDGKGDDNNQTDSTSSEEIKDNESFCKKVDAVSEKGSKSTSAFTPCEIFVQIIGHSSLACFMGRWLYSKRQYQNFTTMEETVKNRHKVRVKARVTVVKKPDDQSEKDETPKSDNKKEKKVKEPEEKTEEIKKEPSMVTSDGSTSKFSEPSQSISDVPQQEATKQESSEKKNETIIEGKIDPTSVIQPSQAEPSVLKPCGPKSEDGGTPALPSISSLTTEPPKETTESTSTPVSSSDTVATLQPVDEVLNGVSESKDLDKKGKDEVLDNSQKVASSSEIDKKESSIVSSSKLPSTTLDNSTSASKEDVPTTKDQSESSTPHSVMTFSKTPSSSLQSECQVPSHIPHPKDVDILEIKLLDGTGREGTAQPEKSEKIETPVSNEKEVSNESKDYGEEKQEIPLTKDEQTSTVEKVVAQESKSDEDSKVDLTKPFVSSSTSRSSDISSTVSSSEAEPHILNVAETPSPSTPSEVSSQSPPTKPTPPETLDHGDSIPPLPPPPVSVDLITEMASSIEASLADDATLSSVLSKAASISAGQGLAIGGALKESVFMRLSNRIKALEQNLTLSTMYMEKLNQKYRKIVDEMQKKFDKKVNLLTNATRKAEAVIKSHKEQLSKLQTKSDSTDSLLEKLSNKLDNLNREVMERHIIGLFLEVVLIMVLFVVVRRWDRARLRRDASRESQLPLDRIRSPLNRYPMYTEEEENNKKSNGKLSAREQLLRSFGRANSVPEIIGPLTENVEEKHKESLVPPEVRKKRNRKRSKGVVTADCEPTAVTNTADFEAGQTGLISKTAGLLFSPARGLFTGISDGWRRKPGAHDSNISREPSISLTSLPNGKPALHKAKSLEVVPEEFHHPPVAPQITRKGRIPTPPPPPPQNSASWKRGTTSAYQKRLPGQPPPGLSAVPRKGRVGGYGNQFA